MKKVIPKNVADEMTQPYIDDAVEKQIKAADVPPRNKLNISFKDADRTDDNKDYESNQEAYEKNHGKLYDMTHNNTIPWKNYVVYLVLLSLLTTVFTFSKYLSGASGDDAATVATFNYSITGSVDSIAIAATPIVEFTSDDSKSYALTVDNKSDVSVSVTPSITGNDGFGVSFTDINGKIINSESPLVVSIGQHDAVINMTIDPENATNHSTSNATLSFKVDQID